MIFNKFCSIIFIGKFLTGLKIWSMKNVQTQGCLLFTWKNYCIDSDKQVCRYELLSPDVKIEKFHIRMSASLLWIRWSKYGLKVFFVWLGNYFILNHYLKYDWEYSVQNVFTQLIFNIRNFFWDGFNSIISSIMSM